MSIPTERLVAEALAKSGLLWIRSADGEAPVWYVTVDGDIYVVSGEGEQFSPDHRGRCEVVTRSKESRARLLSFEADADALTPESPEWEAATNALRSGRLNAPAEDVVERWGRTGLVTRLHPDLGTVVLRGEQLPPPQEAASQESQDDAHDGAKVSE